MSDPTETAVPVEGELVDCVCAACGAEYTVYLHERMGV